MNRPSLRAAVFLGATVLAAAGIVAPASAAVPTSERGAACFDPADVGAAGAPGARGGFQDNDHREITAEEQRAIDLQTKQVLRAKGTSPQAAADAFAGATVPVYVHKMLGANGEGDVTPDQIDDQIAELNQDFAGRESGAGADTAFTFVLAGVDAYKNDTWHVDHASAKYRSLTRQGGANALNIWLVDFDYLGIATFPWDYAKQPKIDGIRVHYDSLPGGSIANYNLGKTATHEAGHWFGLYHTFQGGCRYPGDEVDDTPYQRSPTTGCPKGRDSCSQVGLDPIHNYMDYSYDSCYDQFTSGQADRTAYMWTAYRA